MNNGQPYRLDHTMAAKEQIRNIAENAKNAGKLAQFIDILKKAVKLLTNDPHGWGDPERRTKGGHGVVCHGTLRPVVFHFAIFEQVRGVLLYDVRFAKYQTSPRVRYSEPWGLFLTGAFPYDSIRIRPPGHHHR